MSPQFNSMNELTSYLEAMENRVKTLEGQNEFLSHALTELGGEEKKALPKTSLLSRKFLARAFTVWGHYFVANFFIFLAVSLIVLAIVVVLTGFGALKVDLSQWLPIK
jgi:hypothetical protein